MKFYCPRDFKNGRYYFNKYDALDLFIMVPAVLLGTLISIVSLALMANQNFVLCMCGLITGLLVIGVTFILFLPFRMYHNLLQRLIVEIRFAGKQKTYKWYGFDFNNYEDR